MADDSSPTRSQVFDLLFNLLELNGFTTPEAQASICGVTTVSIQNWRTGKVRSVNRGSLEEIIRQLHFLSRRRGLDLAGEPSLCPIVIEQGAGPDDLERELRDRWDSVYLGHKFLYYHPAGAFAWTQLLATGYGNDMLIRGFTEAMAAALRSEPHLGKLHSALHGKEDKRCGVDLISLGPGDGVKEAIALEQLLEHSGAKYNLINWLTYTPVDVSIPLLRQASDRVRKLIAEKVPTERWPHFLVRPACSDFEDGNIGFASHLSDSTEDRRLVLFLGATFGNLRSERAFMERTANRIIRPGDLLWIEIGVRQPRIEDDGLYALSKGVIDDADAQETVRRSLVEGPHRRFRATVDGNFDPNMRIIAHDGGKTCEIPGSYNFAHDVHTRNGARCSVLYTRRYDIPALREWLAAFGYSTLFEHIVEDQGRPRAAHLLLRRNH